MSLLMQGDVQAMKVTTIPEWAKLIAKKAIALGEKSGHQHTITGDYDMYKDDKFMYIDVKDAGALLQHIHESNFGGFDSMEVKSRADHKIDILEPNTIYKFGIHKKYNPYTKFWEKSRD